MSEEHKSSPSTPTAEAAAAKAPEVGGEQAQDTPVGEPMPQEEGKAGGKRRALLLLALILPVCALVIFLALRYLPGSVHDKAPAASEEPTVAAPAPTPLPTPEPTPEAVRYSIPEGAPAPLPDPACFGLIPLDDAESVMELVRKARDSGLLGEDETVVFDPGVEFYDGIYTKDIGYYLDDSILVLLWKEVIDGRSFTLVEVKIADGSQFRRKLADDTYGSGYTYPASQLAENVNSVVALNADYYLYRKVGIVVYDRELYRFNEDSYIWDYKNYNCIETLFVSADGDFLYKRQGEESSVEEMQAYLEENDILFSLSFGPVLIEDGELVPCGWYPIGEINDPYSRAGIGLVDERHYLYMSVNTGDRSAHMTLSEFASHFAEKPVRTAFTLDGGQTAEVVFMGEPYNRIDYGSERDVSDMIYFATAVPEDAR